MPDEYAWQAYDEEVAHGPFDSIDEALADAQEQLGHELEPGQVQEIMIGPIVYHNDMFLANLPSWGCFLQDIEDRLARDYVIDYGLQLRSAEAEKLWKQAMTELAKRLPRKAWNLSCDGNTVFTVEGSVDDER